MSLIELKNIQKIYGKADSETIALNNINLTINSGEMIAIMGKSGSGKSTLLNIIGCLDKQSKGKYYFEDKLIDKYSNKELAILRNSCLGFIVQYFALIDNYTVYQNIEIPLVYSKNIKINKKKVILDTLKSLGIENKMYNYPSELSGGQCQRTAIARAIVNNPKVILADEPTGALDSETGQDVLNILKQLNGEGKTIIIVTHDKEVASQCNRIINLKDGKIVV